MATTSSQREVGDSSRRMMRRVYFPPCFDAQTKRISPSAPAVSSLTTNMELFSSVRTSESR